MNSNAIIPCSSELQYKTGISCPAKDCLKILPSTSTLKFHLRFFHKVDENDVMLKSLTRRTKSKSNPENSNTEPTQYFCPVDDCKYSATATDLKPFKTIWKLKQHYTVVHAEKKHICKSCEKKFASKTQKESHERLCKVRFVCSCGIGYYGKRGILSHVKRSNHTLPEGIQQLLSQKPRKGRQPKTVAVKPRTTPTPILPKTTGPFKYPIVLHNGVNMNNTMTVICPPNAGSTSSSPKTKKVKIWVLRPKGVILQPPIVVNTSLSGKNTDLAINMTSMPIQVSQSQNINNINSNSHNVGTSTSTISNTNAPGNLAQTHPNNYLVAQDSSCQTDDFLAWLESTSNVPGSSQTDIFPDPVPIDTSTQTQCNSLDELLNGIPSGDPTPPTTAQIETQTEDWLYNFLHDPQFTVDGVNQCQTNPQVYNSGSLNTKRAGTMNDNNNNNTASKPFQSEPYFPGQQDSVGDSLCFLNDAETTCNIQTQTSVVDFGNDVTTQTKYPPQYSDASMSTSIFDFLSHNYTQTDDPVANALHQSSAQTQTNSGCDNAFLSDLLNIETQTDLL